MTRVLQRDRPRHADPNCCPSHGSPPKDSSTAFRPDHFQAGRQLLQIGLRPAGVLSRLPALESHPAVEVDLFESLHDGGELCRTLTREAAVAVGQMDMADVWAVAPNRPRNVRLFQSHVEKIDRDPEPGMAQRLQQGDCILQPL